MRGVGVAIVGVFCFLVAGFIRGMGAHTSDPELVLAASYGFAACGAIAVLAGGIAMGIRLSRD